MNKKLVVAGAILAVAVTPSIGEIIEAFEEERPHRTLILGWYLLVFLLAFLVYETG